MRRCGIRVIYSSDQDGRELFCYTSKICQDFNGLVVSTLLRQKKTLFHLQENNCYMKGKNPPLIRIFLQDLLVMILVKFSHMEQKIEIMYHDNVFRVFFGKLLEHSSLAYPVYGL